LVGDFGEHGKRGKGEDFQSIDYRLGIELRAIFAELGLPRQASVQEKKEKRIMVTIQVAFFIS